jgi:hypothetical protein
VRDPRFLLIGLGMEPTDQAAVDRVIDSESFDWMRYGGANYIVWSSSDVETICVKIGRLPNFSQIHILVTPMSLTEGFGSFQPWIWQWLKRDRGYGNVLESWQHPSEQLTSKLPGN